MLNLRLGTPEDAERIAQVAIDSWRSAYAHFLPADFLANLSLEKRRDRIRRFLDAGSHYWVAEFDGEIQGFASAYGPCTEEGFEEYAELKVIYLHPDHQGKGLGKALLRRCLPPLLDQGFTRLCVFAFAQNAVARKYYSNLGGVQAGQYSVEIEGLSYPDIAYVWPSLPDLVRTLGNP